MNKKSLYIIISVLILSLSVSFVDAFIRPDYLMKISIKIIAFLVMPLSYFALNKNEFKDFKQLFCLKKNIFLKTLLIGIAIYLVIVIGYFATRNIIDFSNITTSLNNNMGINISNYVYVSLYLSFMNSFLEEFFFRAFGFVTLKKYTNRKMAYIFSALSFSIYHVGMLIGLVHTVVLIILLAGVFIGGCIFNYLNESSNNIYSSWIVHMFSNFAINTVGFILFGII